MDIRLKQLNMHVLPLGSRMEFSPDLPLSSSSLVDGVVGSRPALGFATRTVPSAMGTALDLETEDLEINPSSPPANCVSGTNPVASLSLLPV